jgi:seryl-tRNA synthetase/acyl carrier protein
VTGEGGKRVPTPDEFERQLATFINTTLLGGGTAVGRDTRLFEDGHMNSLRILDLIAVVEKTLGRRIPDRAVRLANFRTIATIVRAFHPEIAGAAAVVARPAPDRLFERRTDRARFSSPVDALVARGDVTVTGAGQVALSGLALDVVRAVDRTVTRWAAALGAVEHRYPSLIDLGTLERAGQVASFPQHVTVVSPLASEGRVTPRHAVAPAICYHTYPEWEGKTVGTEPALITACGRCYRHEGGEHVTLERLWEFTMREIIVLGTHHQVEAVRQALIAKASELVTTLDLDASIDPASDPFFTSADDGRRLMQQAGALKYELRLTAAADGRSVAAASFNHHRDFFGARFGIGLAGGATAHSGCVAFGLERWLLGVVAQHGADARAWPAGTRAWLSGDEA